MACNLIASVDSISGAVMAPWVIISDAFMSDNDKDDNWLEIDYIYLCCMLGIASGVTSGLNSIPRSLS